MALEGREFKYNVAETWVDSLMRCGKVSPENERLCWGLLDLYEIDS